MEFSTQCVWSVHKIIHFASARLQPDDDDQRERCKTHWNITESFDVAVVFWVEVWLCTSLFKLSWWSRNASQHFHMPAAGRQTHPLLESLWEFLVASVDFFIIENCKQKKKPSSEPNGRRIKQTAAADHVCSSSHTHGTDLWNRKWIISWWCCRRCARSGSEVNHKQQELITHLSCRVSSAPTFRWQHNVPEYINGTSCEDPKSE